MFLRSVHRWCWSAGELLLVLVGRVLLSGDVQVASGAVLSAGAASCSLCSWPWRYYSSFLDGAAYSLPSLCALQSWWLGHHLQRMGSAVTRQLSCLRNSVTGMLAGLEG